MTDTNKILFQAAQELSNKIISLQSEVLKAQTAREAILAIIGDDGNVTINFINRDQNHTTSKRGIFSPVISEEALQELKHSVGYSVEAPKETVITDVTIHKDINLTHGSIDAETVPKVETQPDQKIDDNTQPNSIMTESASTLIGLLIDRGAINRWVMFLYSDIETLLKIKPYDIASVLDELKQRNKLRTFERHDHGRLYISMTFDNTISVNDVSDNLLTEQLTPSERLAELSKSPPMSVGATLLADHLHKVGYNLKWITLTRRGVAGLADIKLTKIDELLDELRDKSRARIIDGACGKDEEVDFTLDPNLPLREKPKKPVKKATKKEPKATVDDDTVDMVLQKFYEIKEKNNSSTFDFLPAKLSKAVGITEIQLSSAIHILSGENAIEYRSSKTIEGGMFIKIKDGV